MYVYSDGHCERDMPIHCDICHKKTYVAMVRMCEDCVDFVNGSSLEEAYNRVNYEEQPSIEDSKVTRRDPVESVHIKGCAGLVEPKNSP